METIGLLGLQGAFLDHVPHLRRRGVRPRVVRDAQGLGEIDRLILPGGESTVMFKFLREFGMLPALRERLAAGMPAWGICAGTIVLARTVNGDKGPVNALPIAVLRNAYGRQLQSARIPIDIDLFDIKAYGAMFIRAPRIETVSPDAAVHARAGDDPVFIQHQRIMATTFHPELNPDDLFYRHFLSL